MYAAPVGLTSDENHSNKMLLYMIELQRATFVNVCVRVIFTDIDSVLRCLHTTDNLPDPVILIKTTDVR